MAAGADTLPHPTGLARLVPLDWWLGTPGWTAATVVYLAALGAFQLRLREDLAGWLLLAMVGMCVSIEMSVRQIFMPQLESMLAGGLLAGWLVARAIGRRRGLDGPELDDVAHEAVAGVFGSMLVLAALSKLWWSGTAWFDGATHCVTIYEHDLLTPRARWSPLRQWVATQPSICALGAVLSVGVELGGVAMIWPALRKGYALAVVWLFVSLSLFYGIEEVSWATLACALAWSHLGDPGWVRAARAARAGR